MPLYSVNDINDNVIRAYTKCPTYNNNLTIWYGSAEFAAKANTTAAFRQSIQSQLQVCGQSGGWITPGINTWCET